MARKNCTTKYDRIEKYKYKKTSKDLNKLSKQANKKKLSYGQMVALERGAKWV